MCVYPPEATGVTPSRQWKKEAGELRVAISKWPLLEGGHAACAWLSALWQCGPALIGMALRCFQKHKLSGSAA